MIYQRENNGWQLITQPAHAWLSGKMVAAWGNDNFARPTPFEAIVLATRLHDIGWTAWDMAPRLSDDGLPVDFIGTDLDETIPMWRQAVRQVSLIDPYAALLISKHASTIYNRRLEREADPPNRRGEVMALLAEQELIQSEMTETLSNHENYGPFIQEDQLHAAYCWLRVCDLLSLVLCANIFPPTGEISEVPREGPTDFTVLNYRQPEPFHLELDPFPFRQPELNIPLQIRYIEDGSFDDQITFLEAIESAAWLPKKIKLSAWENRNS